MFFMRGLALRVKHLVIYSQGLLVFACRPEAEKLTPRTSGRIAFNIKDVTCKRCLFRG